jgi:hypothetical protein
MRAPTTLFLPRSHPRMLQEFFQLLLSFLVRVLSWFGLSFGQQEDTALTQPSQYKSDDVPPPLLEPLPFSPEGPESPVSTLP